jgi:rhamnosyltransferase
MEPRVSIIIRSYNEKWALCETLPALKNQNYTNWELIVIDSGSTDGSIQLIQDTRPKHFLQIRPSDYNPGKVMNWAMELTETDYAIFLNADATPHNNNWLRPLIWPLLNPEVAAVFGRQVPRPNCIAPYSNDYERCFGTNRESLIWDHFFSMVSSGIRKDVWRKRGFLTTLRYSEDEEYTRWCKSHNYKVVYCPDSIVVHSHNYSTDQAYKRSYGEAQATIMMGLKSKAKSNCLHDFFLPWVKDVGRDLYFCAQRKCLREWPYSMLIRWNQRQGKLHGLRASSQ